MSMHNYIPTLLDQLIFDFLTFNANILNTLIMHKN